MRRLWVLVVLALCACLLPHKASFGLEPEDSFGVSVEWADGVAGASSTTKAAFVEITNVAFQHIPDLEKPGYFLILSIRYKNRTRQPVLFGPEDVIARVVGSSSGKTSRALAKFDVLSMYDRMYAKAASRTVMLGAMQAGLASQRTTEVDSTISGSSGTSSVHTTIRTDDPAAVQAVQSATARHLESIASSKDQAIASIKAATLGKTTVKPGKSIAGRVWLKADWELAHLSPGQRVLLLVRTSKEVHKFEFGRSN